MSKKSRKKDSRQMEFKFPTSSPAVFRAKASASQASKKERVTVDISGRRCFESSKYSNRNSLLARTCEALLTSKTAWSSRLCALTWKVKDTKSNRFLFQLQASALPTDVTESGSSQLWPTPSRGMWKQDVNDEGRYARDIKKKGYQIMLPAAVKLRDKTTGGMLNPTWVEWVMGYKAGYTDLKDWAMLSSRGSRKKSAEQS